MSPTQELCAALTHASGGPTPTTTTCAVAYIPGATNVSVTCGKLTDTVPLLPGETTFEIRVYSDATFIEAFFQQVSAITRTFHCTSL